ncbi:MAG TPA: hypothetical protein VN580_02575 [Clostridia bacterium]|nr:hypothetical protein [Clostridia bacterium]
MEKAAVWGPQSSSENAHSSFNQEAGKLIEEWNGKLQGEGIKVIPARDIPLGFGSGMS